MPVKICNGGVDGQKHMKSYFLLKSTVLAICRLVVSLNFTSILGKKESTEG